MVTIMKLVRHSSQADSCGGALLPVCRARAALCGWASACAGRRSAGLRSEVVARRRRLPDPDIFGLGRGRAAGGLLRFKFLGARATMRSEGFLLDVLEPGGRWPGRPGVAVGDRGEALKVSLERCAPVVMCGNEQPPETVCPCREAAYPVPLDDACTGVLGL